MTIKHFDIKNGFYVFGESNLVTAYHSHPVMESIIAKKGYFTLMTNAKKLENIRFGLVKPNQRHAFEASQCEFDFVFIEPEFIDLNKLLHTIGQQSNPDGIISIDEKYKNTITVDLLQGWCSDNHMNKSYDPRILSCINFIKENISETSITLSGLAGHIHLSTGRLSHLFKEQIGITVQKYILWSRMKVAIDLVVKKNLDLTQASYAAGFYDAAHFSKKFKEIFGIKPSAVYNNSRIVQVPD